MQREYWEPLWKHNTQALGRKWRITRHLFPQSNFWVKTLSKTLLCQIKEHFTFSSESNPLILQIRKLIPTELVQSRTRSLWGFSPVLPSNSTMQLFHLATLHPSDPLGLLIILFLPQNSFSVLLCLLEKEKRDEDFISGQIYATNTRLFTWIKCKLHRIENVIIFKLNYRPLRRRQWHPTPVLLPGKSHGWRSLVGCSPWGC